MTLREAFLAGEESLVSGHGLSAALKEFPVLPRMWVELVTIGEESNSLAQTMTDLADAYQKELENRLGSLLALLEPLSTLAVGGIVLFMKRDSRKRYHTCRLSCNCLQPELSF